MIENETVEVEVLDISTNQMQVFQQDKALLNSQIVTAKTYPRNLKKAIENAITVVTMDAEIAESCCYSLKKGGKVITGPSVNLAKVLVQQLGNMRLENRIVGYSDTHVTAEATCFDMERNIAMRSQIKRSIVGSSGRYSEDMCTIVGNAANSVALRNVIFSVVDAAIIKKVYNAAKTAITGDISDANKMIARRTSLFEGLKSAYADYKLTDTEILASINRSTVNHVTADDIVTLIGFEKTLRDGEMDFESVFRPSAAKLKVSKAVPEDKSESRLLQMIEKCKTVEELGKLLSNCNSTETRIAYDVKFKSLK